ncbi:hypothetical protein FOH10_24410 [Nocardia otitidiscaviarum]|uniref:Uncharacterized protein n=1 Tax=Nocardia otitidiscaviarum TaxID=1823 RepID=A0A516NR71_9NOCA|nr:hypothetical protein [Nocardia otitidiscaviarum]MCP9625306.1 hypothetical protein [Nocardia otitidiscaviarum]QDP81393.1 hypothetical protein FOH10_24410 [Nocardia otitidiscaviarum]
MDRFLVLHDYGISRAWWWVRASSPREILETFAEVEVIEDEELLEQARHLRLDETAVDADDLPPGLRDLRDQRRAQRSRPGFGALVGRGIVHLRQSEGAFVALMELGPDGHRLREVAIAGDGTVLRTGADEWPAHPPVDLYDPELARHTISRDEFEFAWAAAGADDDA